MTNKDDEQVLVIKSDILFKDGKWQGLKTENLEHYIDLIKKNCEFRRRGDVEEDDSFQQIIPYIIFNYQDKYFVYRYLPKAGEKRLVDTFHLGVSGHINKEDVRDGKDILEVGMMREWEEEVDYKGNFLEKKLVGIVKDSSGSVERVHIGLVYNFTGDNGNISIKETEKIEGMTVPLKDVWKYIKRNPSFWTQIIYKEYLSKLIK